MPNDHLVLAGGGHTHALILRRWCMKPHLKPKGLITLINRQSTTLYSGMIPGLIAGYYNLDQVRINLQILTEQAGVSFVKSEINGINILNKNAMVLKEEQLGKVIASFIVNSYIDVPIVKEEDGITIRFKSPVNIFLEELDHDFTSVINKEGIESIKTILNHPHFQDCHSIDDIESRIQTVSNLLDRFQKN